MRLAFVAILIGFFPSFLAAEEEPNTLPPLSELIGHLSQAQRETLKGDGKILVALKDQDPPALMPEEGDGQLRNLRSRQDNLYGIEALLFLPIRHYSDHENLMLDLYNILRRVRSLEGADYYSISKKRRRTLFRQFYAIPSPKSRRVLEDPIYTEIPREEEFFVFQEDTTFGEAVHRMRYAAADRSITISMENIDPLRIFIFTVAKPGGLILLTKIFPSKEGILFYGLCQSEGGGIPGLEERVAQSLGNRVTAIFEWFARNSRGHL